MKLALELVTILVWPAVLVIAAIMFRPRSFAKDRAKALARWDRCLNCRLERHCHDTPKLRDYLRANGNLVCADFVVGQKWDPEYGYDVSSQ